MYQLLSNEDRLLAILEAIDPSAQSKEGICALVPKNLRNSLLVECFRTWPLFSGSITYPVPSPEGGSPMTCYSELMYHTWEGAYGELRKDLLRHCIQDLKQRKRTTLIYNKACAALKEFVPTATSKECVVGIISGKLLCEGFTQKEVSEFTVEQVYPIIKGYYKFSGSIAYPVPCPSIGDGPLAAAVILPWWTGSYGLARYALLRYVLKSLTGERVSVNYTLCIKIYFRGLHDKIRKVFNN